MSLLSTVVCDECGKGRPPNGAHLWLHLEAQGDPGYAFNQQAGKAMVAHATLQVSRPVGSIALTGGCALDLCSRECTGAYFFGPVSK